MKTRDCSIVSGKAVFRGVPPDLLKPPAAKP